MIRDLTARYGVDETTLGNLYSIGVTEVVINAATAEMLAAGVRDSLKRAELQRIVDGVGYGFKLHIEHPAHGRITLLETQARKEQERGERNA